MKNIKIDRYKFFRVSHFYFLLQYQFQENIIKVILMANMSI